MLAVVSPVSLSSNFSTASAASPVGVGPGMVLAKDNTLGPISPHHGRIYAAFVGYINFSDHRRQEPHGQHRYLPDALRRRRAELEHADHGQRRPVDRHRLQPGEFQSGSGGSLTNQVTGRTQFQPEIAVDQVTGTVVLSWRDARDDAANARVATYITASIDGGQTFRRPDLRQSDTDRRRRDHGHRQRHRPSGRQQLLGQQPRRYHLRLSATQMGLAVFDGKVYPMWSGNFNQGYVVNGAIHGRPMKIYIPADGHRRRAADHQQLHGADRLPCGRPHGVSFSVTFDRPIDPPYPPTFTPGDVQVFYHDTTNGDRLHPAQGDELSPRSPAESAPAASSAHPVHGHLRPQDQEPTEPQRDHEFHRHLQLSDRARRRTGPCRSRRRSGLTSPPRSTKPVIGPIASTNVPLPIPSSGTGGSGTSADITTSTITIPAHHPSQLITGITVRLSLHHRPRQRPDDHARRSRRPLHGHLPGLQQQPPEFRQQCRSS